MTFDEAIPEILGGIKGEAKLKAIDLAKDKSVDHWAQLVKVLLEHIYDRRT